MWLSAVNLMSGTTFELDTNVEFGFSDIASPIPAPADPPSPPPPQNLPPDTTNPEGPVVRPRRDAGIGPILDAGTSDSELLDALPSDGAAETGLTDGAGQRALPLSRGAHIALRFDMVRLRASPHREALRRIFAAVPEYQRALNGSGIDPVLNLDRLMVASNNFREDNWLIAGEISDSSPGPDELIAVMSSANQVAVEPTWVDEDGLRTRTWPDAHPSDRRFTLLNDRTFTISNTAMLNTSAIANWAQSSPEGRLVHLPDGAAFSLEIDDMPAYFARDGRIPIADCEVPTRLLLSISEEETGVHAVLDAWYPNPAAAEGASICLERARAVIPRIPGTPIGQWLTDLEMGTVDNTVHLELRGSHADVGALLQMIGG